MKKLLTIAATVGLALTLTGCGETAIMTKNGWGEEKTFELSDGRTVTCIFYNGLSCDWDNAK